MEDNWRTFQGALLASRKRRRKRRKTAVALLGCLVVAGYAVGRIAPWFEGPEPRLEGQVEGIRPAETCRDVLCRIDWPTFDMGQNGRYEQWIGDRRITYTLDPELQEEALSVFRRYNVPYGAFVAVEPASGKILAMVAYCREDPDLSDFCRRATYPAASLIKVITASAALATGDVAPSTQFRYAGSPYRLYPRKISPANRRRENHVSTVAEAMGKSNNVVFGKIGADILGSERLEKALEDFGFNRTIPFDFPVQDSRASVPRERFPLARTAAGFGEVYVSPIHAALVAAAVGNGGMMMQPYVVESMEDGFGKVLYQAAPAPIGRVTSKEVAASVARMMVKTVTAGTSAKVFYRYARRLRSKVGVAGKTGSLTGHNPPGKYEWFIGFAPVDEPKVAVASLVVNQGDLWHIKGTYVAQAVMREFFGM